MAFTKCARALHKLLRSTEIDVEEEQLDKEDVQKVSKYVKMLGYSLTMWIDKRTLVLTHTSSETGKLRPKEALALELITEIAKRPQGLPLDQAKSEKTAQDLIRDRWIEERNRRLYLTKRTVIEKGKVISRLCGTDVCSFCGFINTEENTAHAPCTEHLG